MKKFDKIYVDMDGVLADFNKHFDDLIGGLPHEFEDKHGSAVFWDAILEYRDFFATIGPFAHNYDLLSKCHEMSDKVVILSSPSKFNTSICIDQKRKWLDEHISESIPAIFEKEKFKFSRANCLLIDDWSPNIEKWLDAGGDAHQFKDYETFLNFYEKWKNS